MIFIENKNVLAIITNDDYMRKMYFNSIMKYFQSHVSELIEPALESKIFQMLKRFINNIRLQSLIKNATRFIKKNKIQLTLINLMEFYYTPTEILYWILEVDKLWDFIDALNSDQILQFMNIRDNDIINVTHLLSEENKFIEGQQSYFKLKRL